jgi:hypothetical protein
MTLSNQERAVRCQQAITAYSDEDTYTNLVDFLADAMHWCRVNGHSFLAAFETAVMHFEAETTGETSSTTSNANLPMKGTSQ